MESDDLIPPGNDEIKDNQWLGVTVRSQGVGGKVMVSQQTQNHDNITFQKDERYVYAYKDYLIHCICFQVCAHRHIVKTADSQWGQGQCYILSHDLKYDDLKKPCSGKPTNK